MAGTRVTPLRSVIRALCASTVGEGLAPPEKTRRSLKNGSTKALPYKSSAAKAVIKNAFRPSEKLPYFFTIHYYLLLCQKNSSRREKSEK